MIALADPTIQVDKVQKDPKLRLPGKHDVVCSTDERHLHRQYAWSLEADGIKEYEAGWSISLLPLSGHVVDQMKDCALLGLPVKIK